MQAAFDRGLDDEFVKAPNDEYDQDGWWAGMVKDKHLFVVIRENRVNVYYRGCSLAEVRMKSGAVVGRTHYKHLLQPTVKRSCVDFTDGEYRLSDDLQRLFVKSPAEVGKLERAAGPFAGEDKRGVQDIVDANPNVLDVEIAFGRSRTEKVGPSAPRMDFAALQAGKDGCGTVVFDEVKRFANRNELRASTCRRRNTSINPLIYRQLLPSVQDWCCFALPFDGEAGSDLSNRNAISGDSRTARSYTAEDRPGTPLP